MRVFFYIKTAQVISVVGYDTYLFIKLIVTQKLPVIEPVPAPWTSLLSKENAVLFKHQLLFIYAGTAKKRRSVSSRLCAARQSETEHVSGVEHERSEERSGHISFRAESVFLKIPLRSLNTLSAARSDQMPLW